MTTDSFFGDKAEYIEKLAAEVADLKGVMQDVSQQIRRIERRVDLVLPEGKRTKRVQKSANGKSGRSQESSMSEVDARKTLDRFKQHLCDGKSPATVQSELRNLTMKHGLIPIARVLGMTNTALPPKSELILNIITRLRQSVMLTENIRKMPMVAEKEEHYGERQC